jgi:hypothetical protein
VSLTKNVGSVLYRPAAVVSARAIGGRDLSETS